MLFATLCGICGLGLIINVIIGKYSMDKELDSQHVIVQSESESEGKREVSDSSVVVA